MQLELVNLLLQVLKVLLVNGEFGFLRRPSRCGVKLRLILRGNGLRLLCLCLLLNLDAALGNVSGVAEGLLLSFQVIQVFFLEKRVNIKVLALCLQLGLLLLGRLLLRLRFRVLEPKNIVVAPVLVIRRLGPLDLQLHFVRARLLSP